MLLVSFFVISIFFLAFYPWNCHSLINTSPLRGKESGQVGMGNTFTSCIRKQQTTERDVVDKKIKALPVDTSFALPSALPTWPTDGGGFATGLIDLGGGLRICQISTFNKIWTSHQGGPDNLGASFFEPSPIPDGFSSLGSYGQPNNIQLFGWVIAGEDTNDPSSGALKNPVDYSLIWSSESLNIKKDGNGYFWLPLPPDGYTAVGLIVTNSPEKPSLNKVRCVRSDLTDQCQTADLIWGSSNGPNLFSLRPSNRGIQAMGVQVGTFSFQNITSIACLKNLNANLSSMPSNFQIQSLIQAYSPLIYLHPDEEYRSSSVSWFFTNGALLYHKGDDESATHTAIDPTGINLPQGGSNDNTYWLDLPIDGKAKAFVKKGDVYSSQVYLHVKPMLGATFTDMAIWIFYPFNGGAKAKVEDLFDVSLGKIGQHVGDWEHVTLRISNFNGELKSVFFSQHSGGTWVDAPHLEFQTGSNRVITYASLHGHAMYAKPGLVLQGSGGIGIRNDTAKSKMQIDCGSNYTLVGAEYLGIVEPPWLNYLRKWGPKIDYDIAEEIKKIEKLLPAKLKTSFQNFVNKLPNEILGEEGPTGPKLKSNWYGDEL